MGRTYRNEPDPNRIRRVNELRRSNAAGPHRKSSRKNPDQQAIEESLIEDDLADEALTYWAEGEDEDG